MAPDRQKVMIGGMTLSDGDWGKVKSKIKDVRRKKKWFVCVCKYAYQYHSDGYVVLSRMLPS